MVAGESWGDIQYCSVSVTNLTRGRVWRGDGISKAFGFPRPLSATSPFLLSEQCWGGDIVSGR
jgi:hypothetical protein